MLKVDREVKLTKPFKNKEEGEYWCDPSLFIGDQSKWEWLGCNKNHFFALKMEND